MIAPILEEVAGEVDYAKIGKVNVDDEPELAAAFGAMSIPLLAVVKDGAVVNQSLGAMPKEGILKLLEAFKARKKVNFLFSSIFFQPQAGFARVKRH
jgi:thioredoxin 1